MIGANHICSTPSAYPNCRTLGGCPMALWVTCGPKEKASEQAPFLKSLLSTLVGLCSLHGSSVPTGGCCSLWAGLAQCLALREHLKSCRTLACETEPWPNVGRRHIRKALAPEGIPNPGPCTHLKPICSSDISGVIINTHASHLGKRHS